MLTLPPLGRRWTADLVTPQQHLPPNNLMYLGVPRASYSRLGQDFFTSSRGIRAKGKELIKQVCFLDCFLHFPGRSPPVSYEQASFLSFSVRAENCFLQDALYSLGFDLRHAPSATETAVLNFRALFEHLPSVRHNL